MRLFVFHCATVCFLLAMAVKGESVSQSVLCDARALNASGSAGRMVVLHHDA